jgi:hypothetical protein
MTMDELRKKVEIVENYARRAPDSIDAMGDALDSPEIGDFGELLDAFKARQRDIIRALPAGDTETLVLCSRGAAAVKSLARTGMEWVTINEDESAAWFASRTENELRAMIARQREFILQLAERVAVCSGLLTKVAETMTKRKPLSRFARFRRFLCTLVERFR